MIHGHTKIELYDANKKIKKVTESDNVFQPTNIAKWFANLGDNNVRPYSNGTFAGAPWKCLVGGLLLFRDGINEGSQFMPAGNKMVGKGVVDIVNGDTPIELGSFNSNESAVSSSAITQVYDFTTSQANGTIGCVCLTSREGGLVGYGNASGQRYTGSQTTLGLYGKEISAENRENSSGILAENGRRYRVSYDSDNIIVFERKAISLPNHASIFAGQSVSYSFARSDYNSKYASNDSFYFYYVGNNKIAIISGGYGEVAVGDTLYYLEFDCTNHTLTQKTLVNSYSYPIRIASGYNPGYKAFFTDDGKFCAGYRDTNDNTWYCVLFDLATGVVIMDSLPYDETHGCIRISNGLYALNRYIVDTQNETAYPIDTSDVFTWGTGAYGRSDPSCNFADGYYQNGCGNQGNHISKLIALPMYLATINNLQTAVTKTAAQTMKVTYTLTEEEPE